MLASISGTTRPCAKLLGFALILSPRKTDVEGVSSGSGSRDVVLGSSDLVLDLDVSSVVGEVIVSWRAGSCELVVVDVQVW
jgi:hypothetical protein